MASALITRLPLLPTPFRSRSLSPSPLAGAIPRLASVSFSSGSVCGVSLPRGGGGDAGVSSSVIAAAAALGEAAEPGSDPISLSVQGMMCDGCAASVKRILESQLILRKQRLLCGQLLRSRRQKIGRSSAGRNLQATLVLVALSLAFKGKVRPNKVNSESQ